MSSSPDAPVTVAPSRDAPSVAKKMQKSEALDELLSVGISKRPVSGDDDDDDDDDDADVAAAEDPCTTMADDDPDAPWNAKADVREVTLLAFDQTLSSMLSSAVSTWSRNTTLPLLLAQWNEVRTNRRRIFKVIHDFHRGAAKHYGDVYARDIKFFERVQKAIPFLNEMLSPTAEHKLVIPKLVAKAPPTIVQPIWFYVQRLCEFANTFVVYSKCPPAMFDILHNMAMSLSKDVQTGAFDLKKLTLDKVRTLGQSVLHKVKPADRLAFEKSMENDDTAEGMVEILVEMVGQMTMSQGGTKLF